MGARSKTERDLSAREKEVLARLASGELYKEIADNIGISISTVYKHQHNLYRKIEVENRTEATIKWIDFKKKESGTTGV